MAPPSIQLLHALGATEAIRTTLPLRQQAFRLSRLHHPMPRTPITRTLTNTPHPWYPPTPSPQSLPRSTNRGPASTESTQTDFSAMDVFSSAPAPTASVDACISDGFHLDNGVKISGGSGLLLVSGEAFAWRPWEAAHNGRRLINRRGQWDVGEEAWGVLRCVWPKPGELRCSFWDLVGWGCVG